MATHVEAHPGWDRRRLVYGDWNWLVRDGLDVIRLAFFGGTIAFAVQGRSATVALTAASAVLLLARIINLPRWFDFGLIMAMTLIAYGTALGLYGNWFYYDKVVHGLSPVGYVPVLYIALVRLGVVPDPGEASGRAGSRGSAGSSSSRSPLGIAVGACYESIEWFEDKFGILGGHFVKGLWDTETDLLCDEGGSLVGAAFLTVWALRGWSSHRVTVVPAPEPKAKPLEAVEQRLLTRRASPRESRLADLPLVAQGIALIAGGVLLLALPSPSLRTVGIILGIALLAFAAFEAFEVFRRADRTERGARIATMTASAIAGTLLLVWPAITERALLYAAGAASIVLATAEAASASSTSDSRQRWLGAAISIVAYVFGIALLASPGRSLHAVIVLLGVYLIVLGGLRVLHAAETWRQNRSAWS